MENYHHENHHEQIVNSLLFASTLNCSRKIIFETKNFLHSIFSLKQICFIQNMNVFHRETPAVTHQIDFAGSLGKMSHTAF